MPAARKFHLEPRPSLPGHRRRPPLDGKRCYQLGRRPNAICEPVVRAMGVLLGAGEPGKERICP